jgi:hypothetical protein
MSKKSPIEDSPPSKPPRDINKILEQFDLTADLTEKDLQMAEEEVAIARVLEKWRMSAQAGDAKAVAALCFVAKHALMGLEAAGEENVRMHAATQASWPVLHIPNSRASKLQTEAYVQRIGVGSMSALGASSHPLMKTPRQIKDVAALLFRIVQLARSAWLYRTIGAALKSAVVVGMPDAANKSRRLGDYLDRWGQLEILQLNHLLSDLHRILELPPPTRDTEEFREIGIQSAKLGEVGEDSFAEWFKACQEVLVLIDKNFYLPGAKLREYGQARARKHLKLDGEETDSAYREGILVNLRDALRSFVGLPRTGPRASKGKVKDHCD